MKFLIATQNGAVDSAITANRREVVRGKYVRNGDSPRLEYVPPVVEFTHTFEELCEQFPRAVIEADTASPGWGAAWYCADNDGFPALARENWDTSD